MSFDFEKAPNGLSPRVRFLGGFSAAMLSLGFFHWGDTLVQRVRASPTETYPDLASQFQRYKQIVFQNSANGSFVAKFKSLNSGLVPTIKSQAAQRFIFFSAHPALNAYLKHEVGIAPWLAMALSGAVVGSFNASLVLPLDVFAARRQFYPEAYRRMNFWQLASQVPRKANFRGYSVKNLQTMMGLFSYFAVREQVSGSLELRGYENRSARMGGILCGALAGTLFEAPLAMVGSRMLAHEYWSAKTGREVFSQMIAREGKRVMWRGLPAQVLINLLRSAFQSETAFAAYGFFNNCFGYNQTTLSPKPPKPN